MHEEEIIDNSNAANQKLHNSVSMHKDLHLKIKLEANHTRKNHISSYTSAWHIHHPWQVLKRG